MRAVTIEVPEFVGDDDIYYMAHTPKGDEFVRPRIIGGGYQMDAPAVVTRMEIEDMRYRICKLEQESRRQFDGVISADVLKNHT